MQRRIKAKWRPSLAQVLASTLAVVLALPLAGIVLVKLVNPFAGVRDTLTVSVVPVVIVAAGVGWVLWRILLRPITTLAARADDIRTGKVEALDPLEHYGTAEMVALGDAMRQMGQVLQGREAVLRSYADHVTHELKSPLTVVQGAAELLSDPALPEADRERLVERIGTATERMTDLLDAQRALARASEPMAAGTCRLSDVAPRTEDVVVTHDGTVPLADQALSVVLTHLIGNARAHGATRVEVGVENGVLRVSDNGPGISDGNRDRVFDPFFTTRRDVGGTGMGLAIVRRLLEAQGAQITLRDGPGAVFEISF